MADRAAWKNFKKQMTAKRGTKKNTSGIKILEEESMTVQRLSADVSGKAQKYTRVGAREFVPFEYDEVTVENIKRACLSHFDVAEGSVCDVVAGEQGPSCSSVKQIPTLNVVHVRFTDGEEKVVKAEGNPKKKRKTTMINISDNVSPIKSIPNVSAATKSKFIPRSMSAVEMLRLGREIKSTPTTEILVYHFDFKNLAWASTPVKVDFQINEDPLGTGGFRQAFKATSQTKGFDHTTWVVKKYLAKTVSDIEILGQTVEQHTKKVVQMHSLARNFTARLQQEVVMKADLVDKFGPVLEYNKIYFGKCAGECVTIEEFIPGTFDKHINNTGEVCGDEDLDVCQKAQCFVHYTYERSEKQLMVIDIQGCGYTLFDPEVASEEASSDGEYLFCTGNLSTNAIDSFTNSHICNQFCKLLQLPNLKQSDS